MPGISACVQNELKTLASAKSTNGQSFSVGTKAIEAAKATEIIVSDGSTALKKGDKIIFPADPAAFDEAIFSMQMPARAGQNAPRPAVGLVVEVQRGGKSIGMRLYTSAFTGRFIKYDANVKVKEAPGSFSNDADCDFGNKGSEVAPEKNANALVSGFHGLAYDALAQFIGKTAQVADRRGVTTNVFDRAGNRTDAEGYLLVGTRYVNDIVLDLLSGTMFLTVYGTRKGRHSLSVEGGPDLFVYYDDFPSLPIPFTGYFLLKRRLYGPYYDVIKISFSPIEM